MNKRIDYSLLFIILTILIFGLLMVYSASNVAALYKYNDAYYYVKRQALFLVVGTFLMIMHYSTKK